MPSNKERYPKVVEKLDPFEEWPKLNNDEDPTWKRKIDEMAKKDCKKVDT